MGSMNDAVAADQWEALTQQLAEVREVVEQGVRERAPVHEVERRLWAWALKTGRQVLELFFRLCGDGDEGERWVDAEGRACRRLENKHARTYRSVFDAHRLERVVYGTSEGQRIVACPLDERLGLPEGKYSYLLENWSQELATQMPFGEVSDTLECFRGQEVAVDSLERHSRRLGQSVEQLAPPPPKEEGPLLVVSSDHKGIPMRRAVEAGEEPARAVKQPTEGGLRTGVKKMAQLGTVYSIGPFVRTPEQVVEALFRERSAAQAPDHLPPAAPAPCTSAYAESCAGAKTVRGRRKPRNCSAGSHRRSAHATPRGRRR